MLSNAIKALLPQKTKAWVKGESNSATGNSEIRQSLSAVSNKTSEAAKRLSTVEQKIRQIHGSGDSTNPSSGLAFSYRHRKKCRFSTFFLESNPKIECQPVSFTFFKMTDLQSDRISGINNLVV